MAQSGDAWHGTARHSASPAPAGDEEVPMRHRPSWLFALTLAASSLVALPAAAQVGEEAGEPTTEAASEASAEGDAAASEADAAAREAAMTDSTDAGSPVEERGTTYRFVGLRYRAIIVPKFMVNLFGDGGRTVVVHGVGPEFAIRKDGFEYVFSAWYAGYGMKPTPFKASSDPDEAFEVVESKLKIIYLTADFLWSQELSPEFAINYGMGAGFGFVFGDLIREQSYPESGVAGDPYDYKVCTGVGVPNAKYCGNDNDHYNGYTEPSWANGGSKPIIFPWLALQTGFRYKPHRNFAARFDAGFGTSGFFLGVSGAYGL